MSAFKILAAIFMVIGSLSSLGAAAPNEYIIVLKAGISARSVDAHVGEVHGMHANSLGRRELNLPGVEDIYSIGTFQGYCGTFDNDTISKIQAMPEVSSVWLDEGAEELAWVKQDNAEHGLASLSSRGPGQTAFSYEDTAAKGLFAYVVDSGIQADHPDFGGRVTRGFSINGNYDNIRPHGTMVAGVLASKTYGVAKNAQIIDVRANEIGNSKAAWVLSGINWAAKDIIDKGRTRQAVINVSLNAKASVAKVSDMFAPPDKSPVNLAVEAAFKLGVLTVAAAGNENTSDPVTVTPGSARNALTVGAIDRDWKFSGNFSNHGSMVDILAPGTNVVTISSAQTGPVRVDGTSFASPYVAGVALSLSALEKFGSVQELVDRIKALGTAGKVTGLPPNTVNLVAFNGAPSA
ncbi:oryzin precursor [Cordyceps militaris CM01]|uniref:Oryzin n=1 Tax=Cordyceps militaris (strain CM01) TaxID=983644 RepID=G3JJD0_CORMM|nr:oryzin precursor [Cordyceps militaris CM01]EGX91224.1 oryzin precursor [Cordyceps militaris CM01]